MVTRHYTAGALYNFGRGYELKLHHVSAPENTVRGSSFIPDSGLLPPRHFGGGGADVRLKEQVLGAALAIKF
jgi:hypothetical protein